jgi:hypothetical protein
MVTYSPTTLLMNVYDDDRPVMTSEQWLAVLADALQGSADFDGDMESNYGALLPVVEKCGEFVFL